MSCYCKVTLECEDVGHPVQWGLSLIKVMDSINLQDKSWKTASHKSVLLFLLHNCPLQ